MTFFHLTQLTYEPGHPQELCHAGRRSAAVALTTWRLAKTTRVGLGGCAVAGCRGSAVAVAALTKLNVGAFLAVRV